jgi:hypothetical protein
MKRAAVALRSWLVRLGADIGLEGAFLLTGTAFLAVGASFLSPAGPWLVIGGMAVVTGLALAIPARRAS